MLRLLHTGDWHLGHSLHDLPRDREHAAFLAWLLDQIEDHSVDALLVAGDVFDTANPPARAMRTWFGFLADARQRFSRLDIVVIGGNHDSAARLEAAHPILDCLGVRVVGGLPRDGGGHLDIDRLVVPLHNAQGQVAAWCAAVPFLRAADLPAVGSQDDDGTDTDDPLITGVKAIYDQVLDAARACRLPHHALVALGHCYMVGGKLSDLSERKILGGNQHALPASIFPDDLAYVALGHLHRTQTVGGRDTIRYAGSPIPLAVDEAPYPHQVRLVDIDGPVMAHSQGLRIPRSVDVLRIPADAPATWDQVQIQVAKLPDAPGTPGADSPPNDGPQSWPYLELRVRLDSAMPGLRSVVDTALGDKAVRLVKLTVLRSGHGLALADGTDSRGLDQLSVADVFTRRWERSFSQPPPDPVMACLHDLIDQLDQDDDNMVRSTLEIA